MLRKYHAHVDMLPQVMVAGILSLVLAAAFAPPFAATGRDLGILAVMGCVQLGTGCLLATAASRHLTATELGLLALLEPILGPLWVWTFMGEAPDAALIEARSCWLAVVANEAFAAWRGARATRAVATRPRPSRQTRFDRGTRGNRQGNEPPFAMMTTGHRATMAMKQTFLDFEQPIAELQQRSTSFVTSTRTRRSTSPTRSRDCRRRASSSRRTSTRG